MQAAIICDESWRQWEVWKAYNRYASYRERDAQFRLHQQRARQWEEIMHDRQAGAHRLLQAMRDEWAKDEVAC
jgi:hypothetical protein